MKKAIGLTLIGGGCCAMALAGGQALQAYLFDIQGGPVMTAMLRALIAMLCAWVLFVMGVRLLARLANHDAEARELLAAVLGVFRMVPVPESVRRAAAKVAGLDVVSVFE